MRLNPFGHIETKNFVDHSLKQRFADAAKVIGVVSPFKAFLQSYKASKRLSDGGRKLGDVFKMLGLTPPSSLLGYAFIVPQALIALGVALAAMPGGIFLGVALTRETTVARIATGIAAGFLLAPVALPALAVQGALALARSILGAALLVVASPFVLLTHIGCQIAKCFSASSDSAPPLLGEDFKLIPDNNNLSVSTHGALGKEFGHTVENAVGTSAHPDADRADKSKANPSSTPAPKAIEDTQLDLLKMVINMK